jgi:succinate dehydrogenase/fumarate reductase flavoprotein subunit
MVLLGQLMAQGALIRQESRGAHYRTDYPEPSDHWRQHIVFTAGGQDSNEVIVHRSTVEQQEAIRTS